MTGCEISKSATATQPSIPSRDAWYPPSRINTWLVAAAVLVLASCHPFDAPVRLEFEVQSALIADYSMWFFVSDLALVDANGYATTVVLDDNPWQDGTTAMVALGGQRENPVVSGRVVNGHYEAIEFVLGIPFDRNHGNPLHTQSPFNIPSMFWTWQSGYKFVRLDVGNEWSFHLGSTGCVSASMVRPPGEPCNEPNLARIRLTRDAPEVGTVVVDLDALLENIDTAVEDNCMAAYAGRDACRGLLANLGLDAETGRCRDGCDSQTVFRFAQ